MITAGRVVLFDYGAGDVVMRNIGLAALRQLGFKGRVVAAVLGLTENYVATLHNAALRDGSAALVMQDRRGTPEKVTAQQWEQARAWRAQGASDAEIGRRLQVAYTTIGRTLGPREMASAREREPGPGQAEPLFTGPGPESGPELGPGPEPQPGPGPGAGAGLPPAGGRGRCPRRPWSGRGMRGRCCCTLSAGGRAGGRAGRRRADPGGCGGRGGRAARGYRAAVTGQHVFRWGRRPLSSSSTWPRRRQGRWPGSRCCRGLRALRPQLAAIADRTDPLRLQSMFASAMLAADPVTCGVYYVDDHFAPYTGAKPVGKGWNNKRGRAGKGRADTHVSAHDGRAVCFVTGGPSGLTVTMPKALAERKKAAGPGAKIMLGFDRGGAYAQVFRHCRDQDAHWVTYRRAPLAVPAMLSVITTVSYADRARQIAWAGETVQIKDYGEARQITLFEHGKAALQILTSDFDACPAEILAWLKSRWREENFLKYASENYGTGKTCDYLAGIEANSKTTGNPARKQANSAVREAGKALAAAERDLTVLLADPAIAPVAKNTRLIPAAQKKISAARKKLAATVAARDKVPAKLPANAVDLEAKTALLPAGRRGLQMVLRLLAHNADHWLSAHLNAYLRDDDEYRAITRETLIRGLARHYHLDT